MSIPVRNPLPPGSYAYCEPTCGWRDDTPAAEVNGLLHSQALQHVVHVYVPDCNEPHVTDTGLVLSCGLEAGHGGHWHERDGWKWVRGEEVEDDDPMRTADIEQEARDHQFDIEEDQ